MDRRQFVAASGAGVAAALAGCIGTAFEDEPTTDGADAKGAGSSRSTERYIEVSASGSAETEPDRAILRLGVEATGDDASDVRDELAEGAEALRATFEELGIPEENVQSGRYAIRERPRRREEDPELVFEGTHSFEVELDDVDRVGEVIDAAVDAGADDVGRVNFTLREETRAAVRDEALDDALESADAEAEHIADNRGVEITGTRSVSTSDVDFSPVRYDASHVVAEADDAAPDTEIDSGPVSVSATVRVVYDVSS